MVQVKVVLDIETDGFNPSKVHCIVAKNIDTNVVTVFDPSTMYSFNNWAKQVDNLLCIMVYHLMFRFLTDY